MCLYLYDHCVYVCLVCVSVCVCVFLQNRVVCVCFFRSVSCVDVFVCGFLQNRAVCVCLFVCLPRPERRTDDVKSPPVVFRHSPARFGNHPVYGPYVRRVREETSLFYTLKHPTQTTVSLYTLLISYPRL